MSLHTIHFITLLMSNFSSYHFSLSDHVSPLWTSYKVLYAGNLLSAHQSGGLLVFCASFLSNALSRKYSFFHTSFPFSLFSFLRFLSPFSSVHVSAVLHVLLGRQFYSFFSTSWVQGQRTESRDGIAYHGGRELRKLWVGNHINKAQKRRGGSQEWWWWRQIGRQNSTRDLGLNGWE